MSIYSFQIQHLFSAFAVINLFYNSPTRNYLIKKLIFRIPDGPSFDKQAAPLLGYLFGFQLFRSFICVRLVNAKARDSDKLFMDRKVIHT